jgi:peptidyl-prolyl cis-trans isomerase A (cyclophilin A)
MHQIARGFPAILSLLCAVVFVRAVEPTGGQPNQQKLMDPTQLAERAPDVYRAKFETTKGAFVIEVTRAWAPVGADRFFNLVKNGYYDGCRLFPSLYGLWVDFGINGNPKLNSVWRTARILDDPSPPMKEKMQERVVARYPEPSNPIGLERVIKRTELVKKWDWPKKRGYISFFSGDALPRSTQVYINLDKNASDYVDIHYAPFGIVVKGMNVLHSLYYKYFEKPSLERDRIEKEGDNYLRDNFPLLDYIKSAVVLSGK